MAVSHVAQHPHQTAAAELKAAGFPSTPDKHGNLGINMDSIYNAEFEVLYGIKQKHGLMIRLKRSGTGIRITMGTVEGIQSLSQAAGF